MSQTTQTDQKTLHLLWEKFIHYEDTDFSSVRKEIYDSWVRSRNANVNPYEFTNAPISKEEMDFRINNNMELIEIAQPYIENLYELVKGSGYYIQLSDCDGYILHFIGDDNMIEFGNMHTQLIDVSMNESIIGTSGIGTCLATRKPIMICGEEHYYIHHKNFVCVAAPIFNPQGNLIGAFGISGKSDTPHLHTLGMAQCAAKGIQKELELQNACKTIKAISNQRNLILQTIDSGEILLNNSGRIIQANDNALRMIHTDYRTSIGRSLFDFISFVPKCNTEQNLAFISTEQNCDDIPVFFQNPQWEPQHFQVKVKPLTFPDNEEKENATLISLVEANTLTKVMNNISGRKAKYTFDSIIGTSNAIQQAKEDAKRIAKSNMNVLILSASGTGKELFAHAIHNHSDRANGPFVVVNCASIPRDLVESELFGYEKGAFTGASKNGAPGKFELADGGTIFLDEIGDMPLYVQASVLRVIENREVTRIGGRMTKNIDIRIIAATNKDLRQAVANNTFREDLYYRLNVAEIRIPNLCERTGDIRLLTDHFIRKDKQYPFTKVSDEVYEILENYSWPGNVRQLVNTIERAVNIAQGEILEPRHLPENILMAETGKEVVPSFFADTPHIPGASAIPQDTVKSVRHHKKPTKDMLLQAIENCDGNISVACTELGISRSTIYRYMRKFGIEVDQIRS